MVVVAVVFDCLCFTPVRPGVVNQGCVVVFGYGENKDAIICDENDIKILLKAPPLVTGKVGRDGGWFVPDYVNSASSFSSILSHENKMTIVILFVGIVFVARTGVAASATGAVVSTVVALAVVGAAFIETPSVNNKEECN